MKILGLRGWSGAGKTTLLVTLIPVLAGRGITVSTVKHAHHAFDVDVEGKDSWRHRQAGAAEVLVCSENRVAIMQELRGAPEPPLAELIARLRPVDLVLVEGFRNEAHDKIEDWRHGSPQPLVGRGDPNVVAVASDTRLGDIGLPVLDINDPPAICDFIIVHCGLQPVAPFDIPVPICC